jgi:hypothetical protein
MNVNLQEQDDGQLAIIGLNLDVGFSNVGRLLLQTQDQFYKEDRIVSYLGEKHRFEAFTLKAGQISGEEQTPGADFYNVRVTQFSQFGLSRAGQLEFLKVLLQHGVFQPEHRDKIMKFISMGWFEDDIDEYQIDRANAHKENITMDQGQPAIVNIVDMDEVHLEEHFTHQKSNEFRTLDPQIQSMHQKHLQDHKLFKMMKLAEPQVLMMPAMMFAAQLNNVPPEVILNAGRDEEGNSSGNKSGTSKQGNK